MLTLYNFKEATKQMQLCSLHTSFRNIAKQAGTMPTYWSVSGNDQSNDRGLEISLGSTEEQK
jgi:hypothetical protein